MADVTPHLEQHPATVDYDRRDPRSGIIALVSGATVVVLIGMVLAIYWLYILAYERVDQQQYSGVASKELEAIHAREADHLYKYSFIDKEKGIIRIPVDRAIDLVASEFAGGTVAYNTRTYAVKVEGPGGAAAPPVPPAAPGAAPAPGAVAAAHSTPPPPAASTKQGH